METEYRQNFTIDPEKVKTNLLLYRIAQIRAVHMHNLYMYAFVNTGNTGKVGPDWQLLVDYMYENEIKKFGKIRIGTTPVEFDNMQIRYL